MQNQASKSNQQKWKIKRDKVISESIREWDIIKNDIDYMTFLALYWGEGAKKSGKRKSRSIIIANGDPMLIKFSRKILSKLSPNINYAARVIYYKDQSLDIIKSVWVDATGCDPKFIIKQSGKHKSEYGTCYFSCSNWVIYQKIMTWLECWRNEIKNLRM